MFGKKLREVRMSRHMTQQKLADTVGLALRSYQCYEQGTREPPLDMLMKLSNALDVSVDYLMDRTDTKTVAVACAIPKECQKVAIDALMNIGITEGQIVKESPRAAVVGDGFIVEGVSPKEAETISKIIVKTISDHYLAPAKSVDESR